MNIGIPLLDNNAKISLKFSIRAQERDAPQRTPFFINRLTQELVSKI